MKTMLKTTGRAALFIGVLGGALLVGAAAGAAEQTKPLQKVDWSFDGPFGEFDRAELQRGFQVYKEVCSSCHSLELLAIRDLSALGFSEPEVKAIAAGYQVQDGPNQDGDMFERPGRPSDRFPKPFENEQQARAGNNGALPPDLSLVAKSRMGGPDYIYSLLSGYEDAPADRTVAEGMHYNPYFSGHEIAMAPPLSEGIVEYSDGTPATVEQMAHDVSAFLMWAAEPKLEARKALGFRVMAFLIILTGLLYFANKKVWAPVKRGEEV